MSTQVPDLETALDWEEDLPRPRWEFLADLIEASNGDEDARPVWTALAKQWLDLLADALGEGYGWVESDHFLTLLPGDRLSPDTVTALVEKSRRVVLDLLPEVGRLEPPGKLVVILVRDPGTYYSYLAPFFGEGEYGTSGGMHLREGYPHIALYGTSVNALDTVLAHELVHASLCHLNLPQWVEEGLAQLAEGRVGYAPLSSVNPREARKLQRFWGKRGLDPFWTGEGFHSRGPVQTMSYQLAVVLMYLLMSEHQPGWFGLARAKPRRLAAFLRHAQADDAGEAAAREHLGFPLGDLAGRFLGPGSWAPSDEIGE